MLLNKEKDFTLTLWSAENSKSPSLKNRRKTKMILGLAALDYSIRNSASSKWNASDLGRSDNN